MKWIAKAASCEGGETFLANDVLPLLEMKIEALKLKEETLQTSQLLSELYYAKFRVYFVSYGNISESLEVLDQL